MMTTYDVTIDGQVMGSIHSEYFLYALRSAMLISDTKEFERAIVTRLDTQKTYTVLDGFITSGLELAYEIVL